MKTAKEKNESVLPSDGSDENGRRFQKKMGEQRPTVTQRRGLKRGVSSRRLFCRGTEGLSIVGVHKQNKQAGRGIFRLIFCFVTWTGDEAGS